MSVNFYVKNNCVGGGYDMLEMLNNLEDSGHIESYSIRYFSVPIEFAKNNVEKFATTVRTQEAFRLEVMEAIAKDQDTIDIKVEE